MHRTDAPGATVDNKFTDGDPVSGIQSTIVDAAWLNDVQENIMAVLVAAGITPTKGRAADLLDSLKKVAVGRLLRRSIYRNNAGTLQVSVDGAAFVNASSTFSAVNTNSLFRVRLQGGGGPGGMASSTGAGQISLGSGGTGGGWCEKTFVGGVNGFSITVGAAGVSPATPGGTTSFGPSLSAPGGTPGSVGPAAAITPNFVGGSGGPTGVGGDVNGQGGQGGSAWYGASSISGKGGSSIFGEGAYPVGASNSVGNDAQSPGAGGSAAGNGPSIATNTLGGKGGSGLLIVEEYSLS